MKKFIRKVEKMELPELTTAIIHMRDEVSVLYQAHVELGLKQKELEKGNVNYTVTSLNIVEGLYLLKMEMLRIMEYEYYKIKQGAGSNE